MAIITTVWCQQKNCWLRFESQDGNNNEVKAFYSTQDQLDWVAVDDNEFLWTADYNMDRPLPLNDMYCLDKGVLYKRVGVKNDLTGLMVICNYNHQNNNWVKLNGINVQTYNDLFDKHQKNRPLKPTPYDALPPTPEKHLELLAAQQEVKRQEDADNWAKFKRFIPDYRAQGGQNFPGLTDIQKDFFQQHLSDAMTLNAMVPRDNAQEYLTQLDAILNDENHMILQTPIETSLADNVEGMTYTGVKLYKMNSQEFFYNKLHYFGNHHACIMFEDDNSIHYFDKEALTDITLRDGSERIRAFFEDNPPGEFGRKLDNFELDILAGISNKPKQTTGALHPEIPALQKAYNRAMLQAERDALNRLLYPQYQYDEQKGNEDTHPVITEERINTPNHSFLMNCLAGFSAVAGSVLLIGAIATMVPVLIGAGAALATVGLGTLAFSFFSNRKGADDNVVLDPMHAHI